MASPGGTIRASRTPGLKRPLVITKNGETVRRARWVPGHFFKGIAPSGVVPELWGFPFTLMELFIFTNHLLLKQDFKMWGVSPPTHPLSL